MILSRNLISGVSPLIAAINRSSSCFDYHPSSLYNIASKRYLRIKPKIDYSQVPKLNEVDLEESFVHGSGPGGSKVNKSNNCVVLKHKPTGIVIKNHEFREVERNRKRARELLINKLDTLINGERSVEAQRKAILAEIYARREAEAARRRELKKKVKELLEKSQVQD